jgi:hypothetical protein
MLEWTMRSFDMNSIEFYLSERNRFLESGDINDNQIAYLTELQRKMSESERDALQMILRMDRRKGF